MTKYLDNEGLTHFTGKMKEYADGKAGEVDSKVTTHIDDKKNPHKVTKEQVGLGNVTNDKQIPLSQKGTVGGVATLGADGKLPTTQIPATKTINGQSIFGSGDLTVSTSLYQIVDALPTKDIDITKIYLVPATATTAKNNKTEYIYLGDPNKAYDESKWEKLGDEQKNTTVTTPGGTITVDTALIENSPNPVAGGVVKAKFDEVYGKLDKKVESSDYDNKMATIDSKLKTLENKTIDVDAELKDSPNPVQNRAVNAAVNSLNTRLSDKADSTALTTAIGRISTLETDAATTLKIIGDADGNGISGISKSGNTITATRKKFLTSAAGLATTADLNDGLAGKADVDHNHDTKYAAKKHTHPEYAQSSALNDYVTNTALSEKKFLTDTSLAGYVNAVQPDGTSGNGIASITKDGKTLKVTKATFLTEHQSLADYVKTTALESAIKKYVSQQGYLKKENLKETVTIKLVSINSESDTRLNGTTVTVKSGDTTVSTQTWQGTPIKVEVPCDKEVTIEAAAVKMYVKPQVLKYVPSPLYNREVTIMYTSYPTGVYIINTNNDLMDERSWDKNTQTTVGVALITDKVAIVIAAGSYGSQWSTAATLVDGVTTTTNKMVAKTDYKGKANTEAIVRALGQDALVAYYCSNYTFKNGMKGYLMAAGEAQEIYANIQKISALLDLISPDTNNLADNMRIYTSTQYNQFLIWSLSVDDLEYIHKLNNDGTIAVPIYSLYD